MKAVSPFDAVTLYAQYILEHSATVTGIHKFLPLVPFWLVKQKYSGTIHVALPKRHIEQFKAVQQGPFHLLLNLNIPFLQTHNVFNSDMLD